MTAGMGLGEIVDAAEQMRQVDTHLWSEDIAQRLTCTEADALVRLLRATGVFNHADELERWHPLSDTEEDDEHHAAYLALDAEGLISHC